MINLTINSNSNLKQFMLPSPEKVKVDNLPRSRDKACPKIFWTTLHSNTHSFEPDFKHQNHELKVYQCHLFSETFLSRQIDRTKFKLEIEPDLNPVAVVRLKGRLMDSEIGRLLNSEEVIGSARLFRMG